MAIITRPGEHNPEYYDGARDCWTGHPHKATQYSDDEAVDVLATLDEPEAYILED